MSEFHKAYCGSCKTWHYFGYDGCGAPTQLLSCWESTPPKYKSEQPVNFQVGDGKPEEATR